MEISSSATAATNAKRLQTEDVAAEGGGNLRPLRLYLEGKGCEGFYYGLTFDAKTAEDHVAALGQVELVVDPQTLPFVDGVHIDWVDDARGQGFLVTHPDPRQFRGKFFKRSKWLQRLGVQSPENN